MKTNSYEEAIPKMRVVIISPGLPVPPRKGGAVETGIYEFSRFIRNAEVKVICPREDIEKTETFSEDGVDFIQLKFDASLQRFQKAINRAALRVFPLYDFFYIRAVARHLKQNPDLIPDILEVRNHFYYIPYLKRQFPECRIVLKMHNDFLFVFPYLSRQYKRILDMTDRVIVISDFLKQQILKHYPVCEHKIRIVHNGVSLRRFKTLPSDDLELGKARKQYKLEQTDKVFIYVGRICKAKGVDVLIKAFRKLTQYHPNVKLLIVGSSWFAESKKTAYLSKLETASLPVKDKIIFTGFVPHARLNYLYNLAHVCVVPSVWNEPFGLINLEAMAAGCAVIASRTGAIPEIIKDGKTGLLVTRGDPEALASKMILLLDRNDVRELMIHNAAAYVQENGDWSRVAGKTDRVYEEFMKHELQPYA